MVAEREADRRPCGSAVARSRDEELASVHVERLILVVGADEDDVAVRLHHRQVRQRLLVVSGWHGSHVRVVEAVFVGAGGHPCRAAQRFVRENCDILRLQCRRHCSEAARVRDFYGPADDRIILTTRLTARERGVATR